MEGPAHIIARIAGRDTKDKDSSHHAASVDAQGVRVLDRDTPTMQTDANTMMMTESDNKTQPKGNYQDSHDQRQGGGLMHKISGKLEGLAESMRASASAAIASAGPATGATTTASHTSAPMASSSAAEHPIFTSVHGCPMGDNTHSLNANGWVAASDVHLFEQQQLFNRAKIVERAVHACGSGAFGYFHVTNPDICKLTKAAFLKPNTQTPVFVRFSTVTYGREFPDSARNPRGMAVKFYTEQGNYDVLMVNFPVFFNRDPALGPSVIRSQQRNPMNYQVNLDSTLDFMSLVPESCMANLYFWSDHGTPRGWQHFDAFPCHTFKWLNEAGETTWVRYTFKTEQGVENFDYESAVRMCGEDPDYAKRDLWQTIANGTTPAWRFCVQTMTEQQAQNAVMDPFDCTKEWPVAQYPLQEVGRLVLDRNPENYHRDVEQAAFSPGRLVPGIEPSPDLLLQFRLTFYNDAQLYRLGSNYHQIPVNCPFRAMQFHPLSRDGKLRVDNNGGVEANYYPNSFAHPSSTQPSPPLNWKPQEVHGVMARKATPRSAEGTEMEFLQARQFYGRMSPVERQHLCYNVARAFAMVSRVEVKLRFLMQAYQVNPSYASGVLDQCRALSGKDDPDLTMERIKRNVSKHPVSVDQAAGYIPYPLED